MTVIAEAAGVSVPTAREALILWEATGHATCHRHGDDPDTGTWQATDPGTPRTSPAESRTVDPGGITDARDALTTVRNEIALVLSALDSGDYRTAVRAIHAVATESSRARNLIRAALTHRPIRPASTASGQPRLRFGELREMVAAHLAAHPGEEFTVHTWAKPSDVRSAPSPLHRTA